MFICKERVFISQQLYFMKGIEPHTFLPKISNKVHKIKYTVYTVIYCEPHQSVIGLPACLTATDCLHWIVTGPSSLACSRPPLVLPPYMVMTSEQIWSGFVRTWACVHSTMSCLTSWVWRSICGSTPDWKAWLRRISARRWTSETSLLPAVQCL